MSDDVPALVAFDLDGTLWNPEMYQLWGGGPPFRRQANGTLKDRKGTTVDLIGISRDILAELHTSPQFKDTRVAVASSTDEPDWARECMRLFEVAPGVTMEDTINYEQIQKTNKAVHFRDIQAKCGIPFDSMLFFDNEQWNIRNVGPLGVVSIYCPDGMTRDVWEDGLRQYRESRKK